MILFFFSNSNAPNAISIISTNTAQAAQSEEKQNVLSATRNGVISKALEAERSEGGKSIQEKERGPRGTKRSTEREKMANYAIKQYFGNNSSN